MMEISGPVYVMITLLSYPRTLRRYLEICQILLLNHLSNSPLLSICIYLGQPVKKYRDHIGRPYKVHTYIDG